MSAMTASEMAEAIGTDAKTLRRFMRSQLDKTARPGKGRRYVLDSDDVDVIASRFDAWAHGASGVIVRFVDDEADEGETA